MLLYVVPVFLHFQALVNSSGLPVDATESDETKLAVAVMNFKNQLDNKSGNTDSSSGPQEITKEVIDVFTDVVRGFLHRVSNIHLKALLDKKTAIALKNLQKEKRYTYVFEKTDLESKICWFVPRCLDFIYDFLTDDVKEFYQLYQCYFAHCVNWTSRVHQLFSWNKDVKQYSYGLDQVIKLHDFVSEYPDESMRDGYAETAVGLMENVFEYMNGIDRVTILRTNRLIDKPKRVLGNVTENDFLNLRRKFAEYKLKDEANSKLERVLQKLNKDFGGAISEKSTGSSPPTVPDAVNRLIARAFKMLRTGFESAIEQALPVENGPSSSADTEASMPAINAMSWPAVVGWPLEGAKPVGYSRLNFVETVAGIFRGFCDRAPLITIYLMGNCGDGEFAETMVAYGLQLAYCNNWKDILNTRCPRTRDARKERTCMVKTMLDRLDVSYYWTTTGGEESPGRGGAEDENFPSDYMSAVYDALVKHYLHRGAAQEPAFPVWSTADWMTGRYFLNCDTVKTYRYTVENNVSSTVETNLFELYAILMPWMTSLDLVIPYRREITKSAELVLDDYVLKHAFLVKLYAESGFKSDDQERLERLSETIRWYVDGAKSAREYLSFPEPRTSNAVQKWSANAVSARIASLSQATHSSLDDFTSFMKNMPAKMLAAFSQWVKDAIEDYADAEYPIQLNRLILDNCYSAVNYLTLVQRFAHASGLGGEEPTANMEELYCFSYVREVFAKESKDDVKENEPSEERLTKVVIKYI